MPETPPANSEESDWDRGLRRAFQAAKPLVRESSLDAIQRVSGASSHVQLPGASPEPLAKGAISEFERGSIEGGASRYEVLGEVQRSGSSVIMRARDRDLGRVVDLKLLPEDRLGDARAVQQFLVEAQVAGQLQHPGIAPVYGLGVGTDGRPFVASRHVEGETYEDLVAGCDGTPEDSQRLVAVFEQVCQTVAFAHARGVGHGALEGNHVLVGAFGEVVVTAWRGEAPAGTTERDVASLGSMLTATLAALRAEEPRLDALARRCSTGNGASRPKDAGEIAREIAGHLEEMEARAREAEIVALEERERARSEQLQRTHEEDTARWARRSRMRSMGLAVAAAAGIVIGFSWYFLRTGEDREARARASSGARTALRTAIVHESGGEFAAARVAVQEALSRAKTAGESDVGRRAADLRARLTEREAVAREDAALLQALDDIRSRALFDGVGPEVRDQAYLNAFLALGLDVAKMSTDEAARMIASRTRLDEIVAILDDWAVRRWRHRKLPGTPWESILDVARAADPDPWRNRLRDCVPDRDLDALREHGRTADLGVLPATTAHLLGMLLIGAGDREAGVEVLRRARRHHPRDLVILHDLGYQLTALDPPRWDEALGCFLAALTVRPDSSYVWNSYGRALGPIGRSEEAEQAFHRALAFSEENDPAHFNLGTHYMHEGRLEEALAALDRAIALNPNDSGYHQNRGLTLHRMGRDEEAVVAAREAIRVNPNNAGAWINLGNALGDLDQNEEAEAALRKAIELAPDTCEGHFNLGVLLSDLGRVHEAVAGIERALEIAPEDAFALYHLGTIYCDKLRLYEKAVGLMEHALRLDTENPIFHQGLAVARCGAGDLPAAMDAYRKALELNPDHVGAHMNVGRLHTMQGEFEEGLVWFEKAHELRPQGFLTNLNLGITLFQVGRPADAIPYVRTALEKRPNFPMAWGLLGVLFQMTKDYAGALAAFHRTLELNPNDGTVSNNLAWLLCTCDEERLQNHVEALPHAERAVELDPQPQHWGTLAMARYRNRQYPGAIEAARISLENGANAPAWSQLILAGSHMKRGEVEDARKAHAAAIAWLEEHEPGPRLVRFRAEIEALVTGEEAVR